MTASLCVHCALKLMTYSREWCFVQKLICKGLSTCTLVKVSGWGSDLKVCNITHNILVLYFKRSSIFFQVVIERIARCTRADVLCSMEQLSRPQLGSCQSFRVQRYTLKVALCNNSCKLSVGTLIFKFRLSILRTLLIYFP